jgi:nitroreductase
MLRGIMNPHEKVTDIHPLIRSRSSSRIFDPQRPVSPQTVRLLIEAARWAPSSRNRQPWRFLVFDLETPDALAAARACLNAGNQAWASRAPVLILAVSEDVSDSGRPNAKAQHDLGLANENLLLQCAALGLHCRPMGGFDAHEAREAFCVPEGYTPMVMIAVGYPGEVDDLSQEVQDKERVLRQRRPLECIAFHGIWGAPLGE